MRIGLQVAEAVRSGNDYSGMGVHEAARIGALANAAEILVSEVTAHALPGSALSDLREVRLRGISDPIRIASLDWR